MEMKSSRWKRFSLTVPTTNGQSTWFVSSDMDPRMTSGYLRKIFKMHRPSFKNIMTDKTTATPTVDQYPDSRLHAS